jgi:DNA polymerase IV
MRRYVEVSKQIMEVFRRYTDLVEPLSIDEAFLDITGSIALFGRADQIAQSIKQDIQQLTGLTASVGLAPNKFLAKIASDIRKPDGFMSLTEKDVEAFLKDLPISRLWGVGPKTEQRLHELGFRTIGEVAMANRESLVRSLGSLGEHLYHLSRGQDERPVIPNWEPKSISSETTFDEDTADRELLLQTILQLADHVAERLRQDNYRARKVTLKLRYSSFATHTKQHSLDKLVQTGDEIAEIARRLFAQFPLTQKIRLIGVAAGDLHREGSDPRQLPLFADPARTKEKLSQTVDDLKERFGSDAIRRGSQLR